MRKNTTGQYVAFQAISKTDGSDVITGTPVVYYTIDGGTQAQTTATAVHEGNGQWSVALSQAETNGDHIVFSFVLTGAVTQTVNVYTLDADLTNLDVAVSTRSIFDATTDTVTTDAASRTASQADVSSLATAAALATVDANVDSILVDTGTDIPASIAALNDLSQTDVRTAVGLASANLDTQLGDIPTVSELNARTLVASAYFNHATDQVIVSTNNDKTGYALSSAANDAIGAAFLAYTLTKGSPGTIERAFWQSLKATQLADGEVSGTPTASAFDTNLTAVSGAYDHLLLLFTSGSLAGEARPIDSYSATNGRITLQEPLTSAPSSADEFIIVPDHSHPIAEIADGVWDEAQSGHTTVGTFGYYLDSQVSAAGGGTPPTAAQIADAVWDEVRSPDHVTEGTFGYYVDAQVSSAGAGGSGLYQVTVTVQNESAEVLQGARVNVDGTTLTLVTDSSGQCVFNLDSGIYTLHVSPPAGYQTPTGNVITITSSDVSSTFTLAATTPSGDCDVPWVG